MSERINTFKVNIVCDTNKQTINKEIDLNEFDHPDEFVYKVHDNIIQLLASEVVENIDFNKDQKGNMLSPSLEKRIDFANEVIKKTGKQMRVSAILAATYWMEAEMINMNKQNRSNGLQWNLLKDKKPSCYKHGDWDGTMSDLCLCVDEKGRYVLANMYEYYDGSFEWYDQDDYGLRHEVIKWICL